MKCHNGPYIATCADKLGRELTKDELIHVLDCLAHEALQTVERYQTELKQVQEMIDPCSPLGNAHERYVAARDSYLAEINKRAALKLSAENATCGGTAAQDSKTTTDANGGCLS